MGNLRGSQHGENSLNLQRDWVFMFTAAELLLCTSARGGPGPRSPATPADVLDRFAVGTDKDLIADRCFVLTPDRGGGGETEPTEKKAQNVPFGCEPSQLLRRARPPAPPKKESSFTFHIRAPL